MTAFKDFLRSLVKESFNTRQGRSLNNALPNPGTVDSIGTLSTDKSKVILPDGTQAQASLGGNPAQTDLAVKMTDDKYYVVNQQNRRLSDDDSNPKAYEIVSKFVVDRWRYYIWKLGTPIDKLYFIDVETIVGFTLPQVDPFLPIDTGYDVQFSDNGRHLYVHCGNYEISQEITDIKYGFAVNWKLSTNVDEEDVVTWNSTIQKTQTIDITTHVPLVDPPGLPNDIIATADEGSASIPIGFPSSGDFTYIYWEEEDDPLVAVNTTNTLISGSLTPTLPPYTDKDNIPHVDFVGNVGIEVTAYTYFRIKAAYNRAAFNADLSGPYLDPSGDYPEKVVPITYGNVFFDGATEQWCRQITIPAFNYWSITIDGELPPPPGPTITERYDYVGYLVGGDDNVGFPVGHDNNGIGNVYHHNIFAFNFASNAAAAMGDGTYFNGYGVHINAAANTVGITNQFFQNNEGYTGRWWYNGSRLDPPDPESPYTGIFTCFFQNYATTLLENLGNDLTWTAPDWGNDPLPAGSSKPDGAGPNDTGLRIGYPGYMNVSCFSAFWTNVTSQNILVASIENGAVSISDQREVAIDPTHVVHTDPDFGPFLQRLTKNRVESGTNWAFNGNGGATVYKRLGADDSVHIVTIKADMDLMQYFEEVIPIGPVQYIKNTDYLSLASNHETLPYQIISAMTDEICFIDWLYTV